MSLTGRIAATALAATLGAATSQAPEFAQQYRQRLGGALDELARVITRFDADAAAEGLVRDAALARYGASDDEFLARRGASVRGDIARLARLQAHAARLEETPPTVRPLLIAREGDVPIARATLAIYEPALPLTASGATYGLSGLGAGFLAWWMGAAAVGGVRGRLGRRDRSSASLPHAKPHSGPDHDASEPSAALSLTTADHEVGNDAGREIARERRRRLVRASRRAGDARNGRRGDVRTIEGEPS